MAMDLTVFLNEYIVRSTSTDRLALSPVEYGSLAATLAILASP